MKESKKKTDVLSESLDEATLNGLADAFSKMALMQETPVVEIYKNSACHDFIVDSQTKKIVYIGNDLQIDPGQTIEIIPPIYSKNEIGILYIAKTPLVTNLSYINSS